MNIPRHILASLVPLCLFTGVSAPLMPAMITFVIAQEIPADIQDREALLEEGDHLLAEGELLLQSCGRPLPLLSLVGQCRDYVDDYQSALQNFQEALHIYQLLLDPHRVAESLNHIGEAHYRLENYSEALNSYEQALQRFQKLEDVKGEAKALQNLGQIFQFRLNRLEEASAAYQQSLNIWINLNHSLEIAKTSLLLGKIYHAFGMSSEAIDYFQQAQVIYSKLGDPKAEADSWTYIGVASNPAGQEEEALMAYLKALSLAQQIGDRYREANIYTLIAFTYRLLGEYRESLEAYETALSLMKYEEGSLARYLELSIPFDMSLLYWDLGDFERGISILNESRLGYEEYGMKVALTAVLHRLGEFYKKLDQTDEMVGVWESALIIAREVNNQFSEALILESLAKHYHEVGENETATEFFNDALIYWQSSGKMTGEASTLNELGNIWLSQGNYEKAEDAFHRSLIIADNIDNVLFQIFALEGLGKVYSKWGNFEQALEIFQQGLYLINELGNIASLEISFLEHIGELFSEKGENAVAILFYKESVNLTEQIRQDIQTIPQDLQASYTESIADTYRKLADLLLQQDRVLEAQRVLDLLKVQELDDYLQDVRGNEQTADGVEFLPAEANLIALYDRAIPQGMELSQLREIPIGNRTPEQQERLSKLVAIQQDLSLSFDEFLERPDVQDLIQQLTRTARRKNLDLEYLTAIQDNLRNLNQNAVLLYPLILEDRLELILVTPYTPPIRRTVAVTRAELNQAIVEFRQFLSQPIGQDTRQAQQLYQWLIQPLAEDLAKAGAQTIVYAPDGPLRYIPLAALHDGDRWLVETFRITHITAASLTDFDTSPQGHLNILAGAFTSGQVDFTIGDQQFQFFGLPYAGVEVEAIAKTIPGTTTLVDQAFSPDATLPILDDHTIVHLATHAEFVSGNPDDSFILFGNGDRVTLRDIATWSLPHVDLVVLSACRTAVGDELGNGEEILGFGYQIQRTGARGAIASLWSVSDGGTQVLMNGFYTALNNGYSKAEALQRAQQALITGDRNLLGDQRGIITVERTDIPSGSASNLGHLTHPYYWAPFILIGNGL